MNDKNIENLEKIIKNHNYNSIKFLDKKAFLDAPGLALDETSFTKKDKKTLILSSELIFDYISISPELKGLYQDKYRDNFEELATIMGNLDYQDRHSKLSNLKGLHIIHDSDSNISIRNELDYAQYIFKLFKELYEFSKNKNIEIELVSTDSKILTKLKTNSLPANSWNDIGLNSLTQLYYGWKEITMKLPEYKNEDEHEIMKNAVIQVKGSSKGALLQLEKKLLSKNYLDPKDFEEFHPEIFRPNEIIFLTTDKEHNLKFDKKQNRLVYFNGYKKMKEIRHMEKGYGFNGIRPRNRWQEAQMELLMSGADIIFLYGSAGTGKTLIPMAFGVHCLKENLNATKGNYDEKVNILFPFYNPETSPKRRDASKITDKVVIYRPTKTLDEKELGFLPGDMSEKMDPINKPIYDNLSLISSRGNKVSDSLDEDKIQKLTTHIDIDPILYIRGATFHNKIVIVDECQNLQYSTIKTSLTRNHSSSKIIFTGDPSQDDNAPRGSQKAIYYNALTRIIKSYANKNMPEFMAVLFMPPMANERGEVSRFFL